MKLNKQVNKTHYNFFKYDNLERWSSYWYQIWEILKLWPKDVLEIWVWNKVWYLYLKNNFDINIKNMDIADDLSPDIIWSVNNIPLDDNSFDLVVAYQVLEHLPFDEFINCLKELKRTSKKNVIISLPYYWPYFKFSFRLPFFKEKGFLFKIKFLKRNHIFNWEHYWEIWKKWFSLNKIKKIILNEFDILNDFTVKENPYHHFFILENK